MPFGVLLHYWEEKWKILFFRANLSHFSFWSV
jgi:hypothetical protein